MKINQLKFIRTSLAVCCGLFFVGVNAGQKTQVYRCEQDDVVVFSQVPCDGEQNAVTVKSSQGKGLSTEQAKQKLEDDQDALDSYVKRQQLEQQIADNHRRIAKLQRQIKAQLTHLKEQRFRTEQLRDEAYEKLDKQYKQAVQERNKAIIELNKQLKALDQL